MLRLKLNLLGYYRFHVLFIFWPHQISVNFHGNDLKIFFFTIIIIIGILKQEWNSLKLSNYLYLVLQQVTIYHISFNNWHSVRLFQNGFYIVINLLDCLKILCFARHYGNPFFIFFVQTLKWYMIVVKLPLLSINWGISGNSHFAGYQLKVP